MEALDVPLFDCGRYRRLGHPSLGRRLLSCAGFAHARAPFQVRDFSAGEAAIMDKPFTEAATRPSPTKHSKVPV